MKSRQDWHKSITEDRVLAAVQRRASSLDNPGICIECGQEQEGCEPDAINYECEHCGEREVQAPEELLFYFV